MPCKHRVCEPGKWAQCATCSEQKGKLHKQLGAAPDVKVTAYPYRKNLMRIKRASIGSRVKVGKKMMTVTRLLKNRVIFALNMNPV